MKKGGFRPHWCAKENLEKPSKDKVKEKEKESVNEESKEPVETGLENNPRLSR